jgi:outer membrane protein
MRAALRFAALLAFLLCCGAQAADFKMAIIDMEKVFQEYYKTKIGDANLKRQAEIFKDYSDKLADSLQKLQDEFKSLRDASQNIVLSDAERESRRLAAQDKYRQVTEKEAELRQYSRDKQRQLRDDFEKMRLEIIDEIKRVVKERCALDGSSLVLDKSGMTLNNIPAIIYFNPALDITDSVIKDLNRGHESEKPGASGANAPAGLAPADALTTKAKETGGK